MIDTASLIEELDNHSVISFDVFDTLLVRTLWRPEDVFRLVAKRIDDPSFFKKRVVAEQNARTRATKEHNHEDITIDEIYAEPDLFDARDLELEFERTVCFGNPELAAVLKEAKKRGKKVIAVSDMYLPTAFVRELLDTAGLEEIEELYVSSDVRMTKGSGRLFEHVLAQLGVAPTDMLHIGDNRQADVLAPRNQGISSFHYPAPQTQILQSERVNPAVIRSLVKTDDLEASLLAGLFVRANLRPAGEHADYWHSTGYHIAGPLAYAFTAWIAKRARELDLDEIFFLARDGALPSKIYEKYFADVASKYIYASRRMFFVPSITKLDDDTIRFLTNGEINTPALEFFERLGIGVPDGLEADLVEQFGDSQLPIESAAQMQHITRLFRKYESWLISAADRERQSLQAYLKSVDFIDANRKAIVDIGWQGSTQKYLEKLEIDSENLFGLYLGLSERAFNSGRNEGFAYTYGLPNKNRAVINNCKEYFELILSSAHYSVNSIKSNGNCQAPEYATQNAFEDERLAITARVHAGALEYCDDYIDLARKLSLGVSTVELALTPSNTVLSEPTSADIEMIGKIHHAKGFGTSDYHPVIPPDEMSVANWLYFLVGGKKMRSVTTYWTVGARRKNYTFNRNRYLGQVFEKTLWLLPKIRKARMLGVRATLAEVAKIVKRRWLQS